jgi:hypothetical protein
MTRPDPAAAIASVLAAHRLPDQPHATFAAIDAAVAATIGHKLFTITIQHPALNQGERFYTSRPDVYPVGGRKSASDAPLMKMIITEGKHYIGSSRADIIANFGDHDTILALGCESIVNTPLVWNGQTIGSMNTLHQANWYADTDMPTLQLFAALALPAALMIART